MNWDSRLDNPRHLQKIAFDELLPVWWTDRRTLTVRIPDCADDYNTNVNAGV